MGLLDFFRKEKRENAEVVPQCDDVLLRALLYGGEIDEDKAMSVPALAGCVSFIADTVAALPIKLYRDSPQEQSAEELTDDPRLPLLNDDGHDLMNAYEVKRAMIKDMLLHGAGYMHIQRSMNDVMGLRYVDRRSVAVSVNSDPIFKEAELNVGGRKYYPWDFVILTRNSRNGVTGVGLLKQINDLLSTMRNEMIYESNIAKTGGNKKGFLQSERKLSQAALDELKRAWRELYSNNGDNMMVLNDGVKYQQAASTSVEMQLNEHKATNSQMIAMCCGLNPAVISGNADTDGYMAAVRTSVLPVVEAFQAALNKSLLLETEKKALYFVMDTTELLKGDMVSRFNAYAVGLQNNFLRIDEVRYKENLPPIGFNYIKLGLQDVLLDPDTGDIYTPNTNQMVNVGSVKGLTAGGEGGIIEERARHYIRGDRGRFNGSYSDGNDGGNGAGKSGGGKSSKPDTLKLPDDFIGRSVSAKAKNYDVMDLATGEIYHFSEGTKIQNVEVFAGKGVRTPYRKAGEYARRYGGKATDWQHVKGTGYLDTPDGERYAEVHWSQCAGIGKVEFFVKRWLDE